MLNEELLCFLVGDCLINHIVIDECHAMVEASQDFRPKYKQLGILKEYFPIVPYTALTATASAEDIEEINSLISFKEDFNKFIHNLDRPNLSYHVVKKVDEVAQLMGVVTRLPKKSSILVYCNTRDKCKIVSDFLNKNGYKSDYFYSTITKSKKKQIQDDFLEGTLDIIVSTTAFGTGINKPNVRAVVNLDIPASMNDLLQQGGRAGRDGLPSSVYVLYSPHDANKLRFILQKTVSSPLRLIKSYQKLDSVLNYAKDRSTCRRTYLLRYYGQALETEFCGNCDNCFMRTNI